MMIRLKTIIAMLLAVLPLMLVTLSMSGCRALKVNKATEITQGIIDTFQVTIVPVAKITGQLPVIGDSLSVPTLNMSIHRISETQAVIKTPIRTKTVTEKQTTFIPVRNVDKSRVDNRTFTDSYNESKVKDKSNSGVSGNKFNLGAWWLLLLAVAFWLAYQNRKLIFPWLRL